MGGWAHHEGKAIALPIDNIDTDQIIPARFMSASRSQGYGNFLLHDLRLDEGGDRKSDFILNAHSNASILVTGKNFGSGSSREAAVYALVDAGFKAIVAPSFGDIFAGNAINNGLLPARLSEKDIEQLFQQLGSSAQTAKIDLEAEEFRIGNRVYAFTLDEAWKTKLLNGWDDIDLTQQHAADISTYKNNRIQTAGWAWPHPAD